MTPEQAQKISLEVWKKKNANPGLLSLVIDFIRKEAEKGNLKFPLVLVLDYEISKQTADWLIGELRDLSWNPTININQPKTTVFTKPTGKVTTEIILYTFPPSSVY